MKNDTEILAIHYLISVIIKTKPIFLRIISSNSFAEVLHSHFMSFAEDAKYVNLEHILTNRYISTSRPKNRPTL